MSFGAPPEVIEQAAREDGPMPVMAANRAVLELFLAAQTQWRVGGMDGVLLGLDYGAVEALSRCLEIKMNRQMFDDLRIMELAALEEMGKRQ